jgi:hypothetical protein
VNPEQVLQDGVAILEETLRPHGFRFIPGASGTGSGGRFASGAFVRGERKLELHFRHSLGLVTYHLGAVSVPHEDFMRAAQAEGDRRYPGFSHDPLQAFRDLAHDLSRHGQAFLSSSDAQFRELLDWVATHLRPQGLGRVSRGGAA